MAAQKPPLSVLLVEDDLDLAQGLAEYLSRRGISLEFAVSSREARHRIANAVFDLVLMDVQLADGEGISLCAELKSAGLRTPVLFLTARGHLEDKLRAFEAGAVDYVVKPFAAAELLARIRALTKHIPSAGGWCIQAGSYSLDHQTGVLRGPAGEVRFSGPALVILRRLMEASPGHVGRGVLNAAVWGCEVPRSDPLRMHIYELRRELASAFGDERIETVRGEGYRFRTDHEAD